MNARMLSLVTVLFAVAALTPLATADVPLFIGHQGRLMMIDGGMPPDDSYSITFSLWDDPDVGTELWSETQDVQVTDGMFNVALGSVTPIPIDELSSDNLTVYLQTQVAGDSPMTPRFQLNSVPYSRIAERVDGDNIKTEPGQLKIETEIVELSLRSTSPDNPGIVLNANGSSSSLYMVDSFFDISYRVDLDATETGANLRVSNLGSSGEDGVSIDVGSNSSNLIVSNIGSSGEDGVSIGVDDGAATCGIEHEDIGALSAVNSSADASGGHLTVSNIGSSGEDGVSIDVDSNGSTLDLKAHDTALAIIRNIGAAGPDDPDSSSVGLRADNNGGGTFVVDSFFDITYRCDQNTSEMTFSREGSDGQPDTTASYGKSGDFVVDSFFDVDYRISRSVSDQGALSSLEVSDAATTVRKRDKATVSLAEAICSFDDGTDSFSSGLKADASGGGTFVVDSFFDITYRMDADATEVLFTRTGSDGIPFTTARYGSNGDFVVDSFFDVDYRISRSVSESGALLKVSNIGSSGEDGVSIDVGSSSSTLTVSNIGSSGLDGVSISSGGGGGGRIALWTEPLGQIQTEIVALSLRSAEPRLAFRPDDAIFDDDWTCTYAYDSIDRLIRTTRSNAAQPGDSTESTSEGYRVYSAPYEFDYNYNGLQFSDPTGTTFSVSPLGELSSRGGGALALDPGAMLGVGALSPGYRLYVDGDVCAAGYLSCSDRRFKKNVTPIPDPVEKIRKLNGVQFDWRVDEFPDRQFAEKRQVGFVAQDIREVLPEVVSKGKDGYYSVDYAKITPLLVEAIKKQQEKIDRLEQKIEENNQLRAEIRELRDLVRSLASSEDNTKKAVWTEARAR